MVDLGKRLQDINCSLSDPVPLAAAATLASSVQAKEQLLDELMELVENIDMAKDLSSTGGLPTLVDLMHGPHASLRWRAAEVFATCVQNNPDLQASFLHSGAPEAIWQLLDDQAPQCQVKGLLAVSCLVRGHAPALTWFRQKGGPAHLVEMARREDVRLQRKCLQVLTYSLRSVPGDAVTLLEQTPLLANLAILLASEDVQVRGAAVGLANHLATDAAAHPHVQQVRVCAWLVRMPCQKVYMCIALHAGRGFVGCTA